MLNRLFAVWQHIILILTSFIASVPLLSCVLVSLKSDQELVTSEFFSLPDKLLNLDNYSTIIQSGYVAAIVRTLVIVMISTLISSFLNACVAYVLNRFSFKGKRLITVVILISSLIPNMIFHIHIFKMMVDFNLVNTMAGYILVISGIDAISITIFMRYFSEIKPSLDESAILSGCSHVGVFFKVHLPLLRQALITVAIIKGINVYNEYFIANIYLLDTARLQTVTVLLYSFSAPFGTRFNVICAGVLLAALPTILLFILFQKRILKGLTGSSY